MEMRKPGSQKLEVSALGLGRMGMSEFYALAACHACCVAAKRDADAKAAAWDLAAGEHLGLPELTEIAHRIDWATTIRAGRLAPMLRSDVSDTARRTGVTDAKWWIDQRDDVDAALLVLAAALAQRQGQGVDPHDVVLCAA